MEAKKPCSDEPKVINKVAMDDKAIEEKIVALAFKRKLHDRYEEAAKAKRQKSIQVLDYVPEQSNLACIQRSLPITSLVCCILGLLNVSAY